MLKSYRRVFGLILLLMILALPGSVLASRGGTDANGGHYDHTTGLYHYHHGYPAHQHENGICPYTGEKWELKIPEKPATLEEWKAQKHTSDETPTIDNETPENDTWDESSEVQPVASASGGGAEQTTATRVALRSVELMGLRCSSSPREAFRGRFSPEYQGMPSTSIFAMVRPSSSS